MKKIYFILSILVITILFGLGAREQAHAAAGDGKGYVNIYGHSLVDPACDPDKTDCSSDHPFAKNCNTQNKSCSSQSTDVPSDVRPIWKFVCQGLPANKQCEENGTSNGSSGTMSIGNPDCGTTIQLDAYAPGKGPGSEALDYLVYYSGDCAQATETPTPTPSPSVPAATGTATPVPSGPACGMTCTSDPDCANLQSCTSCINGTCQPSPTTPPTETPTPTPEFNPAMCACNGTTVSSLVPGAQATVTSNYQIVGEDQSKATLNNVTFVMYKGDNDTGIPVLHSDPIPVAITSLNNERTQYQAQWTFTVPTNVDPNIVYRVMTSSDCKASGLSQTSMSVQVAGVSTGPTSQPKKQPTNLWTSITGFFKSLFGLNNQAATTSTVSNTSLSPSPTVNRDSVYTVQGNQIQIGQLKPPATMLPQAACNIIRFQFGG